MTAVEDMAAALRPLVEHGQRPPCGDRSGSGRWTSEDRAERTQAVGLCQLCPLLDACHALAAEIRPSFGVWAAVDFSPEIEVDVTTRRRRQQRPAPTEPVTRVTEPEPDEPGTDVPELAPALSTEEIRELGRELVAELAQDAGDPAAVRALLLAWLDTEDVSRLGMACMAGIQLIFSDCLTRTPTGAWTLNPPPTEGES